MTPNLNTLGDTAGNSGSVSLSRSVATGTLGDFGNSGDTFTAFDGSVWDNSETSSVQSSGNVISDYELLLTVDLTQLEDVQLRMNAYTGGNAPITDYSTTDVNLFYDAGSGFTSFGSGTGSMEKSNGVAATNAISWDLSSIVAIENQSSVAFRFEFADKADTSGDGGNIRVDNLQLTAVAIPEPSSFALLAGALGLAIVMLRRRRA